MISRSLKPLKDNSFFIFGARGTGKTTFIADYFERENCLFFNLLDPQVHDDLLLDPNLLKRQVLEEKNRDKVIVLDEVQKLPKLLDIVHDLIVSEKRIFVLSGSSARRLKQTGVNLLAGRAYVYDLYPLSSIELGSHFDLQKALEIGLLPQAYLAPTPDHAREFLRSYILTYVQKEIQMEQWVRNLEPFRIFLEVAAQMSGKVINKAKIAREVGVDPMTIASYYEILEDTLMGITLPSFHRSIRKAQKVAPKFYLFDGGVKRALDRTYVTKLVPKTSAYGEAFEQFIIMEIVKLASYARFEWKFSYLKTKDDLEVDFIVERAGQPMLLIEIKSKHRVDAADTKALELLGSAIDPKAKKLLISNDKNRQIIGSTVALHWRDALSEMQNSSVTDL